MSGRDITDAYFILQQMLMKYDTSGRKLFIVLLIKKQDLLSTEMERCDGVKKKSTGIAYWPLQALQKCVRILKHL